MSYIVILYVSMFSHTHGAPTMEDMPWWQEWLNMANKSYVDFVIDQVTQVWKKAFQNKNTAVEIFIQKWESGIAYNRRKSKNNLHDPTLSVLWIQDAINWSILWIVWSTACHPISMRRELSADFVGVFRDTMKKNHPGAFSMFLQGFAATSNPSPHLGDYKGLENQRSFMNNVWLTLASEVSQILSLNDGKIIRWDIRTWSKEFSFWFDTHILNGLHLDDSRLQEIPYRWWYAARNTLRTHLQWTQQLLRLGFLEEGNPVSIWASSHEVDGSIWKDMRSILGWEPIMLGFSNGVQGYMVRPENPEDECFPIRNESPLNYEAAHSHVWYGNSWPLIKWWYEKYIETFRELVENTRR